MTTNEDTLIQLLEGIEGDLKEFVRDVENGEEIDLQTIKSIIGDIKEVMR